MEIAIDIPKYNLNEEEEKKEILRQYRGLLRVLKLKLKPGDKQLLRIAFEMAAKALSFIKDLGHAYFLEGPTFLDDHSHHLFRPP